MNQCMVFICYGSPIKLMFLHAVYRTTRKVCVLSNKNSSIFFSLPFAHEAHEPINSFSTAEPVQTLFHATLSNFHLYWSVKTTISEWQRW